MWILKIKLDYKNFLLGNIAKKFNVDLIGYPITYYKDKKHLYLTLVGFIIGDDKSKKKVIAFIKKNKDFLKVEFKNDFIITLSRQPLSAEVAYNPKFINLKPFFISKEGYHIWELAAWEKKDLKPVIDFAKKYHKAKILKLKQEKLTNISFTNILLEVSKQQKKALELAISKGYYEYPKKSNLHKLAKMMKLSYSTFQEHLKRAEAKLMPILIRNNRL